MDTNAIGRDRSSIMAFFSIDISYMAIRPEVPSNMRRKLNVMLRKPTVPCYVLGQLGKNEDHRHEIFGSEIIENARSYILRSHMIAGGGFVRVDCKDNGKLTSFYENNGFKFVQMNESGNLMQYVRYLDMFSNAERNEPPPGTKQKGAKL